MALFVYAFLYTGNALAQIKHYKDFDKVTTLLVCDSSELVKLRAEVQPIVDGYDNDLDKALAVCAWVNDQVSGVDGDIEGWNRTPTQVLYAMRNSGTGASCGYRSLLYVAALRSVGIQARQTSHIAANGGTHASASVKIDNQWVLIDPTFNEYYKINGTKASAIDLHDYYNTPNSSIEVMPGHPTQKTVIEYSIKDIVPYYEAVCVYERRHYYWWQALPVIQYFNGISYVVYKDSRLTSQIILIRNIKVYLYNFIIPLAIIATTVIIASNIKKHVTAQ